MYTLHVTEMRHSSVPQCNYKEHMGHENKYKRPNNNLCCYCGALHGRMKCPAFGIFFTACGKINHFARVGKQAQRKTRENFLGEHEVQEEEEMEDMGFLSNINTMEQGNEKRLVNLKLTPHMTEPVSCDPSHTFTCQFDTGATTSTISEKYSHLK